MIHFNTTIEIPVTVEANIEELDKEVQIDLNIYYECELIENKTRFIDLTCSDFIGEDILDRLRNEAYERYKEGKDNERI